MKSFVFVFVSLFFVNANAQTSAVPGVNVNLSADQANQYFEQQKAETEKRQCTEAYKEYSEAKKEALKEAKENKEEAQEKLLELKKELAEKTAEAQEQLAEAEESEQQATIEFSEKKKDLTDQLNDLEKQTQEEADAKVKELQDLITQLEKNITVDRDEVNTTFQNSIMQGYEQCKQAAEADFMSTLNISRDRNQKANSGYVFSGGATFAKGSDVKKARKQAQALHKKCVTETNRVLEAKRSADIKKLGLDETRLNQEIEAKKKELDRLTNSQYTKQVQSIQEGLNNAQMAMIKAQEKAAKDKQRISQKISTEQTAFNDEIALVSARASAGIDPAGKKAKKKRIDVSESEETANEALATAKEACCNEDKTLKYQGAKANAEICKNRSGSKAPKASK